MFSLNSEIVDAARAVDFAERLRTLSEVEVMVDQSGEPIYFTGNSVVILRIKLRGEERTMRCYRAENPNLRAIYGENYHPKELNIAREGEKRVDIVICDWVDGVSLDTAIRRVMGETKGRTIASRSDYHDCGDHNLRKLSIAFDQMASELLRKEWAHGDISPDNIIVGSDGTMQLIDLDTAYTPALAGQKSLSLGTPQFQSPLRTLDHFDKSIDDFSLMLISLSLRALSEDVWLHKRYFSIDNLLLNGQEVCKKDGEQMQDVMRLMAAKGLFAHYRMAKMLYLRKIRAKHLTSIFDFALMESSRERFMSEEELADAKQSRERLEKREIGIYKLFNDEHGAEGYFDEDSNEILIPALFDSALNFEHNNLAEVTIGEYSYLIDKCGTIVESITGEKDWD